MPVRHKWLADVIAWHKPHEVTDTDEAASCITVASVQTVVAGHATALLQGAGRRDRSHLYVSLVCATRTLDLECASEAERDRMLQGACGASVGTCSLERARARVM